MGSTSELDLRGVALPVSLLKCKRAIMTLGTDEALDVLVHDPEVAEDMVRIIERSLPRTAATHDEGDHYRVHVEAGSVRVGKTSELP